MGFKTEEILALGAGKTDFAQFHARHTSDIDRMAGYIERRWRLPCWTDTDDVRQEVAIGMWCAASRFDPTRGPTAASYLVFQSIDKAKKAAHKWRKARGNRSRDVAPSTLELRLEDSSGRVRDVPVPASVESFEQARDAERLCEDDCELLVMRALATRGSIDGAASVLYDDPNLRLHFEFASRDAARRHVRRIARTFAARAA